MALTCGIIGIANTGKTTLFNCMSSNKADVTNFAFSSNKSNIGIINVPDPRLEELVKCQPTEKVIPATVEIVDVPGLVKGANKGEGVGNKFLADIRSTDAIIHVLRCFDDESIPHVDITIDPVRDKETIELELQIKDIESIDKKLEKLRKLVKIGDKDARKGVEVLEGLKIHIEENFESARTYDINEVDKIHINDMQLLTMKPVLYVCNVDDLAAVEGNDYVEQVKEAIEGENAEVLVIAARLESEISELEEEEERNEFLEDAGLSEPGVNKLIRGAYKLLNLTSFFTVGPKEVRAWTIRDGMSAPQAAGVIHSDLERGFIRAEVMKYEDFTTLGSEAKVKEAGKFRVEGKGYIVADGDVLHIRFNV